MLREVHGLFFSRIVTLLAHIRGQLTLLNLKPGFSAEMTLGFRASEFRALGL